MVLVAVVMPAAAMIVIMMLVIVAVIVIVPMIMAVLVITAAAAVIMLVLMFVIVMMFGRHGAHSPSSMRRRIASSVPFLALDATTAAAGLTSATECLTFSSFSPSTRSALLMTITSTPWS